jgi:hypothetical protein
MDKSSWDLFLLDQDQIYNTIGIVQYSKKNEGFLDYEHSSIHPIVGMICKNIQSWT